MDGDTVARLSEALRSVFDAASARFVVEFCPEFGQME